MTDPSRTHIYGYLRFTSNNAPIVQSEPGLVYPHLLVSIHGVNLLQSSWGLDPYMCLMHYFHPRVFGPGERQSSEPLKSIITAWWEVLLGIAHFCSFLPRSRRIQKSEDCQSTCQLLPSYLSTGSLICEEEIAHLDHSWFEDVSYDIAGCVARIDAHRPVTATQYGTADGLSH